MATQAGVGKSTNKKGAEAGREAAQAAMAQLGGAKPDMVLVFATTGYDQTALLQGVIDVTGEAPLSGCSAEGVITQQGSDESSHAVSVMAIRSDSLTFDAYFVPDAAADSSACGAQLADLLNHNDRGNGKVLLLFPDGMTAVSSDVVAALDAKLAKPLTIVGGGAGEMMRFEQTYQYFNGQVHSNGVAAVLIGGDFLTEVAVSHGSEPLGVEHEITAADGGWVMEIDDEPAWDLFREYCEDDPEDLQSVEIAYLSIAERLPKELASEYGELIIRTPMGLNKENGALFFPGGLKTGTTVNLTRRDAEKIHAGAVAIVKRLQEKHAGRKPALVFQFDCCGRGRLFFGDKTTEMTIEPMQQVIGKDVPWIGMHCYGEIAPLGQKTYFHNYTVSLCAIYEPARP